MSKTTTIHSSGESGAAAMALRSPARLIKQLVRRIDAVFRRQDKYHPEKYYMRGPGPKWRACHEDQQPESRTAKPDRT